ncbi:hypothetical protein V6N11_072955 [Hibiscus sabdariffa]|uniref:Uncharacterized protein n=1 Tax=Hibiscus sabdariffa TaxID=183260 RepID=A0ABR2NXE8_9ROSI
MATSMVVADDEFIPPEPEPGFYEALQKCGQRIGLECGEREDGRNHKGTWGFLLKLKMLLHGYKHARTVSGARVSNQGETPTTEAVAVSITGQRWSKSNGDQR